MKKQKIVTVSELKKSPATVLDKARDAGTPVPIMRNNRIEGHYVPNTALELIDASDAEMHSAFEAVLERHGDAIAWLAKN